MHEVLVNLLGGLSLPRKSVVRLTDRPDMTLVVYRGRKTTMQQQQQRSLHMYTSTCKYICCKKAIYNKASKTTMSLLYLFGILQRIKLYYTLSGYIYYRYDILQANIYIYIYIYIYI